ncbi:flagellin, partial [Shewanella frigidimarina]
MTTTIGGLGATDTGVLSVVAEDGTLDSYDLATYKGDSALLATDLGKAGYDVSYDKDSSVISITAKNVNGIQIAGATAGTAKLGGNVAGATAGAVSKTAELKLSSAEKFTVAGTTANELTSGLAAGGGSSILNKVSSIDINTASGAQDALAVIDAAIGGIDAQRADLGAVQNRM